MPVEVVKVMPKAKPRTIDLAQADAVQQILPCSPVLSSHTAAWKGIHLEYHCQPAHETPEYCFPGHTISIGLRYKAKEFKANGRLYKDFAPGNIGIIPANQNTTTQAYGNAEFILLSIAPGFLNLAAHETLNINELEIVPQIFGRDPLIYQLGLELKRELEFARDDSYLYAESMATALAVHLMRRYAAQTPVIKTYSGGLSPYKLKTALAYINERLDQNLSLAEMAAVVQMSPHYFASLFKQSTGLAPYHYVTQCRIEKAKQLLRQSDLAIVDICQQVGFQSQSHFTNVFRRYTTVTPKTYRDSL